MKDIEDTSNLSQLYNMPNKQIKNPIVKRNNDELSGWGAEEEAPAEDMLPPNAITSPKMFVRIGQKGGKRSMNHRSLINEMNSSNEFDDEKYQELQSPKDVVQKTRSKRPSPVR
jgi:hypothetical protein